MPSFLGCCQHPLLNMYTEHLATHGKSASKFAGVASVMSTHPHTGTWGTGNGATLIPRETRH